MTERTRPRPRAARRRPGAAPQPARGPQRPQRARCWASSGSALLGGRGGPRRALRRAHRHRGPGLLRRDGPGRLRLGVARPAPSADGHGRLTAASSRATSRCPIVGAANATAVAGGFEVLMGCDLVVASADARFGLPEVKRGLFAAGGGTFLGHPHPAGHRPRAHPDRRSHRRRAGRGPGPGQPGGPRRRGARRRRRPGRAHRRQRPPRASRPPSSSSALAVDDRRGGRGLQAEWQAKVFGSEDAREGADRLHREAGPRVEGPLSA